MWGKRTRREFLGLSFTGVVALVMVCPTDRCRRPHRDEFEIAVDNAMTRLVRQRLTDDREVDAMNISVLTYKLVVTLKGQVRTAEEQAKAITIARDTEVERDAKRFKVKGVEASELQIVKPQ